VTAAILLAIREQSAAASKPLQVRSEPAASSGWRLLLSAPILLNLVFFVLLAMMSGALYNYSVVALGALYGTPVTIANAALSANLLLSAIGVLVGGLLVGRTARHGMVTTIGLAAIAVFTALIAEIDLGTAALIAAMSLSGFFSGVIMPSRDMIVREVTPPGSFGKVFGFVTTGFNIGGIVSANFRRDHGPRQPTPGVLGVAAISLIAIAMVATRRRPAD
jgi:MFS family permease